jgi:hypothetical protein
MSVDLPALHGDIRAALNTLLALPPGGMAVESEADVSEANSAATNKTNFNAWSAANPGVPIYFRKGTYDFAAGLNPKGPMFGAGRAVTNLRFPEASVSNIYVSSVDYFTIADLSLVSTSTATPFAVGINDADSNHITLDGCNYVTVRNIWAKGAANIGIILYGCDHANVIGNWVSGTTRDGIHTTKGSSHVQIIGNDVWDTGDDCIAVISYDGDTAQNEDVTVVGNTVSNLRARGITIEGGKDVTVGLNVVNGTAGYGILINSINSLSTDTWATTNCVVSDNIVNDAGSDGIHVNGNTDGVKIADNLIRNSGSAGIRVLMGRVVLSDNIVLDAGEQGITIDSVPASDLLSAYSVIRDNLICRSQARGIYVGEIASVTISGNVVQQPSENGVPAAAIRYAGGSNVKVTDNRVDATDSTRTPTAVEVHNCTGGQIALNYGTGVTTTVSTTGSTGIVTS